MAILTAYKAFNILGINEIDIGYETQVSATELSGHNAANTLKLVSTSTGTSTTSFVISPTEGIIQGVVASFSVSSRASVADAYSALFGVTNIDVGDGGYNLLSTFDVNGYIVGQLTDSMGVVNVERLTGFQAELAAILESDDVLNGSNGNDRLSGYDGNDSLLGNDGDDFLKGYAGNDTLVGGIGNDTCLGGSGRDTLSGGSGNDVLDGGSNSDMMTGGAGDDTYYVDNTADRISEVLVTNGVSSDAGGSDLVFSTVSYTLGANLERLTLSGGGRVNGTGNALNNSLLGNSASNVLAAGSGNDTLEGGGGSDTLTGGIGDDTYVLRLGPTSNSGNATIIDDGGTADTLDIYGIGGAASSGSGSGSGSGSDMNVGFLFDQSSTALQLKVFGSNGIYQTVSFTSNTGTLPTAWCFEKVNVKDAGISFTVTNAATGTDASDMMLGGSSAQTLNGGKGTDFIYGAGGNDTLIGGLGKDFLQGGAGSDTFKFNTATDSGLISNGASDRILDFSTSEDKINLSAIDANPGVTGDQAFTFLGTLAPTANNGLGKVWISSVNNQTIVNISTNADANPEMQIEMAGFLSSSLMGSHFVL